GARPAPGESRRGHRRDPGRAAGDGPEAMSRFRTNLRRPRCSRGWTLVELLITVGVFTAAMGSIVEVGRSSTTLRNVLSRQGDMGEGSRHGVDALVRELRWADTSTLVVTSFNGSTKLTLRTARGYDAGAVIWSPTITYQVNVSNVDSNHDGLADEGCLVRIESGRTTVLCSDVPAGGVSAPPPPNNVQL